ncbi:MAG: LysM peptidoglycan-binding domain-containing protein [Gammaproteobacteria bacterium]
MLEKNLFIHLFLLLSISWGISPSYAKQTDIWDSLANSFELKQYFKHPEVQNQIQTFVAQKTNIANLASQAKPYIFYIYQEVKKQNMPGEIVLIPKVESAYDPFALSPLGAVGLWQIMPGTGSGLGLQNSWWFDARRDIAASTEAALSYLHYLYQRFDNDWLLAMAAYHSGEGTVVKAIKQNTAEDKATDFWSLPLPNTTKVYVPRVLALAAIISAPQNYNIELPYVADIPYFEEVSIGAPIELAQAARLAEVPLDEVYQLNPGYNQWATAPQGPYHIILPIDKIDNLIYNLIQMPQHHWVQWTEHVTQPGDTLSEIAYQYKTDLRLIKDINTEASNNEAIYSGQILLIPKVSNYDQNDTYISNKRRSAIQRSNLTGPQKIIHVVQPGDNFEAIEKKYAINADAIRYWNRLSYRQKLQSGQQLILWKQRQKEAKNQVYYTVQPGNTLSHVAQRFQVSISDLKQWNNIDGNNNYVFPEQRLSIYYPDTASIYTIKPGDTLSGIAKRFLVSVSDLKRWNEDIENDGFLYPDQELVIHRT